jgi:hypothetical protein
MVVRRLFLALFDSLAAREIGSDWGWSEHASDIFNVLKMTHFGSR